MPLANRQGKPVKQRKKRTRLPARGFDGRTRLARRAASIASALRDLTGVRQGQDALLDAEIDRASQLQTLAESLRQAAMRDRKSVDSDDVVRAERLALLALSRVEQAVNKPNKPKTTARGPDLHAYLAQRAQP